MVGRLCTFVPIVVDKLTNAYEMKPKDELVPRLSRSVIESIVADRRSLMAGFCLSGYTQAGLKDSQRSVLPQCPSGEGEMAPLSKAARVQGG